MPLCSGGVLVSGSLFYVLHAAFAIIQLLVLMVVWNESLGNQMTERTVTVWCIDASICVTVFLSQYCGSFMYWAIHLSVSDPLLSSFLLLSYCNSYRCLTHWFDLCPPSSCWFVVRLLWFSSLEGRLQGQTLQAWRESSRRRGSISTSKRWSTSHILELMNCVSY